MLRAAEAVSTTGRTLLQNGSSNAGNASYADFEAADTVNSDLTKEGKLHGAHDGLSSTKCRHRSTLQMLLPWQCKAACTCHWPCCVNCCWVSLCSQPADQDDVGSIIPAGPLRIMQGSWHSRLQHWFVFTIRSWRYAGPTPTDTSSTFNYLIDALLAIPDIRSMYMRRLRSLMDEYTNGKLEGVSHISIVLALCISQWCSAKRQPMYSISIYSTQNDCRITKLESTS